MITFHEDEDVYIGLDLTGSMNTRDAPGGLSRLDFARMLISRLAVRPVRSGTLTVFTFGALTRREDVTELGALVANHGTTETHDLVRAVVDLHRDRERRGARSAKLLILSDGVPSSPDAYEDALARWNRGVVFLSVGARSSELAEFLGTEPLGTMRSTPSQRLEDVSFVFEQDFLPSASAELPPLGVIEREPSPAKPEHAVNLGLKSKRKGKKR